MKKIIVLLLSAIVMMMVGGCSDNKQAVLMADIQAGIDSCNYERLAMAHPGIDSMDIKFDGCTVSFDSVNIKEEMGVLTLPAFIVQKHDSVADTAYVKFMAKENEEGKWKIFDSEGLYLFSAKYPLAAAAVGSGAVDATKGDAEVFRFMQDPTNTATIKDMVANLKDSLFEFGKFKYAGSKEHNKYDGAAYYYLSVSNKADLINKTKYTFSKAKLTIRYSVHLEERAGLDYPINTKERTYLNISNIKPDTNSVYFSLTSTEYDWASDPVIIGISDIPEEEINEAMKTYKYSGKEYAEYLEKNKK